MSRLLTFSFITISILSILFGFLMNEDLSTGGTKFDFNLTMNAVKELAVGEYNNYYIYTKHFPFHYLLLSKIYSFFNDEFILRIFYLIFSSLFPLFFYLNLKEVFKNKNNNILLICFSLLFLPYFRSSAIWANSHLTAIIFLLISNYFYLKSSQVNKNYKFLNLFFLAFSTYTIQSYAIFYIFYLLQYYKYSSNKEFVKILFCCVILSIPGFIFIFSGIGSRSLYGLNFTHNIAYSIISNFSIIFFYYCFFIFNKENLLILVDCFSKTKKTEFTILFLLFLICVYFYDYNVESLPVIGRGFFYKLSFLLFNNKLLFFLSSLLGIFISILILKKDKKFLYIIIFVNIMSSHFVIFQKYFEPIFILLIFILFKNFLSKNIINYKKNIYIFIFTVLAYFVIASINMIFNISNNLISSF